MHGGMEWGNCPVCATRHNSTGCPLGFILAVPCSGIQLALYSAQTGPTNRGTPGRPKFT